MLRNALRAISLAALAMAVALAAPIARAGTTGKLTGTVMSEKKEPLAGVNVRIESQRVGAVTDDQGRFFIIGVPAGIFTVRANLLGYAAYVAANVQIQPDFNTELNITLKTEAVQLSEVRVEAERPLLQKDATGTTRFISASDIQKLPTRGYRGAAAQQTGVVNFQRNIDNEAQNQSTLIVRGGRPNEVAFYVDGFSQQDPLTGTSSTSISNNAVEEVVMMTGGFSPEYGRVQSGIVNVVTREGASRLTGTVEGITDNLSGSWIKAPKTDYNVYDGSLGGPLLPNSDNLTFYFSGERRWQRDRSPSHLSDAFKQELSSGTSFGTNADGSPVLPGTALNPDFKPNNGSSGDTYQGKLAWTLNDHMNIKAGTLGSEDDWRQYEHSYLFNLEHTPRYQDKNQSFFATFNHALSSKTFYNLGANFFKTERKRGDGVAFDNLSPQYVHAGGDTILSGNGTLLTNGQGYFRDARVLFNGDYPLFYLPGHVFDDYLQRNSSYIGGQGSLSSQIDVHNQVKVGGDYQRHTLRFFEHFFPIQLGGDSPNLIDLDSYGYSLVPTYTIVTVRDTRDSSGVLLTTNSTKRVLSSVKLQENADNLRDGPKHPKTWSAYAQDKFEREGVIVNGGLRYDHINVDTPALLSDKFPLGNPDAVGNIPDSLENKDLVANRTYARLSPRLGVAFPVDEKTILRFNYGQFYQQPNLQDLYVSYSFLQHKVRTGGYFVGFGNPNLKPERTTAYEAGIARQIGENVRLDLTAYYKDVKDLVEITNIPSFPNNFSSYQNRDFATIKGLDVGFAMRPINHFSANINYSLSFAQGTGSVSNTQRNIAWTASQPPKQTAPLDFDQRHKLSMNLDFRLNKGEGPILGSNFRPFENAGINVLLNVASGTPYTPTTVFDEVTLAAVANQPAGPLNSRYGPWNLNLDLKASRQFQLTGLNFEAYVWVLNAFDSLNPTAVYTSSGSALTTNWLNTNDGQTFLDNTARVGVDGSALYKLAESDPNLYSNPRMVRFGLRASF